MADPDLVALGIDIGGTATRVLVVDTRGQRRGAGRSAGANPTAHPQEAWAHAISEALRQALAESGPVEVRSVVVGVAGGSALRHPDAASSFDGIIRRAVGGSCPIQVASDATVAFAAGTPEPHGTILVAGTGAVAAAIRDRSPVSVADGHGWLLGDAGSGFWIGRAAVRAALADLDGRGPATSLRPRVLDALLGQTRAETDTHGTRQQIVQAVHARPPVELSSLAPLVSLCAEEEDPVALRIARDAVGHLICAAEAVRSRGETTPIVVAGTVAAGDHVIADLLRQHLEARWPACIHPVHDGVTGAAWLALSALPGVDQQQVTGLHQIVAQLWHGNSRGVVMWATRVMRSPRYQLVHDDTVRVRYIFSQ